MLSYLNYLMHISYSLILNQENNIVLYVFDHSWESLDHSFILENHSIIRSFNHSWESFLRINQSFNHSIILEILLENPSWNSLNVVLIIHSSTSSFLAFFRVVLANPCAITLTRITGSFVRCPPSWLLRSIDCLELNTQSFTSKL